MHLSAKVTAPSQRGAIQKTSVAVFHRQITFAWKPYNTEVLREFLIVMRLLYKGLLRYLKILTALYGCYMGKFVLYENSA